MPFSANSKLKDIVANPAAKAVIDKYLPSMLSAPGTKLAMNLTLKACSKFAQAQELRDKLPLIEEELAKIE